MPDVCQQDLDRETFGLMDQHIPLDCIGVFGVLIFLSMFAGLFLSAPVRLLSLWSASGGEGLGGALCGKKRK